MNQTEKFLDRLTKHLWDKNYPRSLILFNVINLVQALAGILLIAMSFVFKADGHMDLIVSIILTVWSIFAIVIVSIFIEDFEKVIIFCHAVTSFIIVPLMFYFFGKLYACALFIMAIASIHSYIMIDGKWDQIFFTGVLNTFYIVLIVLSLYKPEWFPYQEHATLLSWYYMVATFIINIYVIGMARLFVYLFQSDSAKTKDILEKVNDASVRDTLTGAYNEKGGRDYLDTAMKKAWDDGKSFCFLAIEVDFGESRGNKYIEDVLLLNAYDSCRQYLSSDAVIAKYGKNKFFAVVPNCTNAIEAEELIIGIGSQFRAGKENENIEDGKLYIGKYFLKRGMSVDLLIESAEIDLQGRMEAVS